MSESIFPQSALDRLANPERLDAPLILVRRTSWLLAMAGIPKKPSPVQLTHGS